MLQKTKGYQIIHEWMIAKNFHPFDFQEACWDKILKNESGLVNAPTGCGKTFSVFLGVLIQYINENPDTYQLLKKNGLQLIWISPLRALAKDIGRAMGTVLIELEIPWKVAIRNGDTSTAERQKQKNNLPTCQRYYSVICYLPCWYFGFGPRTRRTNAVLQGYIGFCVI